MAIRTLFKNLLPKNRQEELAKANVRVRFRDYKNTARMLAVALQIGLESVPNFLNTAYIDDLTLDFKHNDNITILLFSLEQYGFTIQKEALQDVRDNHTLIFQGKESMRQYIVLLWNLFYTPDPQ